MSLWYRAGTISVTNGNTTVTGTGTAWVEAVRQGDALIAPDGRSYEIASVDSNTGLTLVQGYLGSTASAQDYAIQPTRAVALEWLQAVQAFQSNVQGWEDGPLSGLFGSGTEGAPGVAFAAQPNMGVRRVSNNRMAAVVGGVHRVFFENDKAEFTVPITGAAVQANAADATAGKVLRVGAGGLLGSTIEAPNDDLDDITRTGFYFADGDTLNKPGTGLWVVQHIARTTTTGAQIAVFRSAVGAGAVAVRNRSAAGWSDWYTMYTQASILGTVSQSSGVPTGAIIERDSGANGSYTRLADGTQICTHTLTLERVGVSHLNLLWTFPAAFSSSPKITATFVSVGYAGTPTVRQLTAPEISQIGTAVGRVVIRTIGGIAAPDFEVGETADVHVVATGKWFE